MSQRVRLFALLAIAVLGLLLAAWFVLTPPHEAAPGTEVGTAPTAAGDGEAAPQADAIRPAGADAAADAIRLSADSEGARGQGGLTGRVLLTDRTPLPEVEVVAYRSQHSMWRSPYRLVTDPHATPPVVRLDATRTDGDGRFRFAALPAATPLMLAVAPRTGRSTLRFVERTPRTGEVVDLGDILVPRGCGVSGRVVDPAGQPVAGVRVRALDALEFLDLDRAMDGFDGSGAIALHSRGGSVPVLSKLPIMGTFFTAPAPHGEIEARDRAHAVEAREQLTRAEEARAFMERKVALDARGDRLVETLHRGDARGAVTAVRSVPPWAATLERELPPFPETTTDAEGRFTLTGVSAARLRLWLSRRGHAALHAGPFHSRDGGERDVGTLTLTPARQVTAEVVDATGRSVADAEVVAGPADGPDGLRFLSPAGRTDSTGRVQADAPPDGQVVFAVRRAADEAWHAHGPVPSGDAVVRITLPVLPDLTVRVLAADGKPPRDVDVRATSAVRTRGGDGSFVPLWPRVPVDRVQDAFVLHRLPSETLRVVASAPGCVPGGAFWSSADLKPGAPAELPLQLAPATPGRLRVLAKGSREPLDKVRVIAAPESLGAAAALFPLTDPFLLGITDAHGELALTHLPAGTSTVLLQHPRLGWQRAQVTLPGAPTEVLFDLPGAIVGVVRDGAGPPRDPVRVAVQPERNDAPVQEENHWILVPVAGDGTFRIDALPPGSYQVVATPDPGHMSSLHAHLDLLVSSSPTAEETVTVQAGKETTVVLHLFPTPAAHATGRIQGRVSVDGQPLPDLEVTVEGTETQALTNESGGFVLERVAADEDLTVSVRQRSDSGPLWLAARAVRVAANQTLDVDLQVELARVDVRLLDATTGAPVPGLRFELSRQPDVAGNGRLSLDGRGDAQGRGEVCAPTGTYQLRLQSGGWARGRSEPTVLTRGRQEVRIEVRPAFRVAGRVEAAAGTLAGQRLTFRGRTTGHEQVVGVRNDRNGGFQFRSGDLPADTYDISLMPRRDCAPVSVTLSAAARDLVLRFEPAPGK